MASKIIYVVRHGQTDYNLKGIIQGSGVDSSLNATGRTQADAFFDEYQEVKFDKIYVSGLKRTFESVKGFVDKGIDVEKEPLFNEISWGDRDGHMTADKSNRVYWDSLALWKEGKTDYKVKGAESPQDVYDRVGRAIDKVVQNDGETILVCMHGRSLRILLSYVMQTPLMEMDQYHHHNLGLYQLEYENGQYKVLKTNDLKHLKKKSLL